VAATPAPSPPATTGVNTVEIRKPATVLGQEVRTPDGKDMGRIVDILVDADGHPRAAVVDFGGFLGVGNRRVAVDWARLHFPPGDSKDAAVLDLTPDQIRTAPEYKDSKGPVSVVVGPATDAPH
jgi:hypothetical protein